MNAQVSAISQSTFDRAGSEQPSKPSLRSTFPVWLLAVVGLLLGALAAVVGGRSREAERLLYARMPLKTFANSLRYGWLPEPTTVSVQALAMRFGSTLFSGRVLSIIVCLAMLLTTRAIAAELGLRGSRMATLLLLTNGVVVAQGFLADSAAQEALAAALVALFALRRVTRPGLISYLLLGFVSAGACVIEPRLVVLVGAVAGVATLVVWPAGRRWEIVLLGVITCGALGVAVVVAYRTKQAGDFATESVWTHASLSHLAVVLASTVALLIGVTAARRLSGCWIVVAWIGAGLIDTGWSLYRSGPPVWWSIPAIWLVMIGTADARQLDTPSAERTTEMSPLTFGRRFASVSIGSLLTVISALGWVGILSPATHASTLPKTLFNESRLGDQVIFLPSATRIAFEFARPIDRLLPVPEFPEAPWGGYPSSDPVPDSLSPAAAERIADTATRVWVISDSSRPGSDLRSIDALSFLTQQMPVVDEHSGSIRVQCFELGIAP